MNNLKRYRIATGLSQYEFSEATKIPRWAIQLMELGYRGPTLDEMERIVECLGVTKESLFPSYEIKTGEKCAS